VRRGAVVRQSFGSILLEIAQRVRGLGCVPLA